MIWKYAVLFYFVVHQCFTITDSEIFPFQPEIVIKRDSSHAFVKNMMREHSKELKRISDDSKCECGKPGGKHPYEMLIVKADSDVIPIFKYPFMIALFVNGKRACGAVIISQKFVLTAAHCVVQKKENAVKQTYFHKMTCKSGNDSKEFCILPESLVVLKYNRKTAGLTNFANVKRVIPHSGYMVSKLERDIALLETSKKLPCDEYTAPVCLPTKPGLYKVHEKATLAGWGKTSINETTKGPKESVLRESSFRLLSQKACRKFNKNKDHICVQSRTSGPCSGDSGSPLFRMLQARYYVIGIASYILSRCKTRYPDYYIDVKMYLPWIKKHTKPRGSLPKKNKLRKKKQNFKGGDL